MTRFGNEAHFETQHLLGDLKHRAASSTAVSVAGQATNFAFSTLSVMVLARLLSPNDFGLVAMVTGVMGFLRVFRESGLSIPTLQQEQISHAQVSNLFWINAFMGGAASLLLIALAPIIVWFFREPRLLNITITLASTFLLSGLNVQHRAILGRQMRFTVLSVIDVVAVAAGVAIGIAMALADFRYWSLIWQMIGTEIVLVVLPWVVCPWRPGLPRRRSGTRPLVKFGASVGASTLVYSFVRGSDILIIGRVFGSDAVGLYSRAMALLIRPFDQILPALHSVFVPALSRLQDDPVRYRRAFLLTFETVALSVFPATALILALAKPLTRVLFGPGWDGVTPIFTSLAIAGSFIPLTWGAATWIFYSLGRGSEWLQANLILSVLTIISFVAGLPFGPVGVALGFSISGALIAQPVLYHFAGRKGPVSATDLWISVLRYLPLWGVVWVSSYIALRMASNFSPLLQLFVCSPIGLMAGAVFVLAFAPVRHRALHLVREVSLHFRRKRASAA